VKPKAVCSVEISPREIGSLLYYRTAYPDSQAVYLEFAEPECENENPEYKRGMTSKPHIVLDIMRQFIRHMGCRMSVVFCIKAY
jgi:hypothetical protein